MDEDPVLAKVLLGLAARGAPAHSAHPRGVSRPAVQLWPLRSAQLHSSAAPRARAGYGLARSASTDFVYTVYNTIVSGGAHDNANRNDLHNPLQ